jgi:prepilin-type N-terminal cleavage/methylation domain-containing protein
MGNWQFQAEHLFHFVPAYDLFEMVSSPPAIPTQLPRDRAHGFTLIELLVVIGIMGLMLALAGPAISALRGSGDLGKAAGDIQGILEQARSYAMANNTYVYAGIQEQDGVNPSSNSGVGRVAIGVVASKTGMRGYSNTATPGPLLGTNINPLGSVKYFDNVHLTNSSKVGRGGNMTRSTPDVDLGTNTNCVTTFQIPPTGTAKYSFKRVLEFDPQGVARYQTNSTFDANTKNYLEIPLMSARGNVAMTNSSNTAVIQIDGITGAVRLYRP